MLAESSEEADAPVGVCCIRGARVVAVGSG